MLQPQFASVDDVQQRLGAAGYLTDHAIATTVFLADRLGKPLLIEGPAGVGKTELAKSVATAMNSELIRLPCDEGREEAGGGNGKQAGPAWAPGGGPAI